MRPHEESSEVTGLLVCAKGHLIDSMRETKHEGMYLVCINVKYRLTDIKEKLVINQKNILERECVMYDI